MKSLSASELKNSEIWNVIEIKFDSYKISLRGEREHDWILLKDSIILQKINVPRANEIKRWIICGWWKFNKNNANFIMKFSPLPSSPLPSPLSNLNFLFPFLSNSSSGDGKKIPRLIVWMELMNFDDATAAAARVVGATLITAWKDRRRRSTESENLMNKHEKRLFSLV